MNVLVDPDQVATLPNHGNAVVLDVSWFAPEAGIMGTAAFRDSHIPGSRHFDLEAASDPDASYPNTMPTPARFADVASALGIDRNTPVVIYDRSYVSARVWWMFRRFGHEHVAILDGGLRRWTAEGRPLEAGDARPFEAKVFDVMAPSHDIATWKDVRDALETGEAQVVDARTPDRFSGVLPAGYPGLRSGHMPGAVNLPWTTMLEGPPNYRFRTPEEAERIFRAAGIDPDRPIITTCGSGVTAAVLAFQLARMGRQKWRIYDGSWNEWGRRADLPRRTLGND
jgi:thiosulfate/3-mercaptopyruvate sulfurtransferase